MKKISLHKIMTYRGIALEGGGVAGIGHLGVIQDLHRRKILKNLTHFSGSSVGAIVASVLACRIQLTDIQKIFHDLNFRALEDDSGFVVKDIYRLWKDFGWNKGENVEKWFGDVLKTYVHNSEITFLEIYQKFGSFLIITGTDVGYRKTVYYDPESSPHMPIRKAVRESTSIPFFYCPCRHDDNLYIDGGVLDNYPIERLYKYLDKDCVIGIKLISSCEMNCSEKILPKNIFDFAKILIKMIRAQAMKMHVNEDDWKRTIRVDVGEISAIDFDIKDSDKDFLIAQGELASKKFFSI